MSTEPRAPIRPGTARRLGLNLPQPNLTIRITADLSRLNEAIRLLPTQAAMAVVARRITEALRPCGYGIQEDH
jgi:hypothetical protein